VKALSAQKIYILINSNEQKVSSQQAKQVIVKPLVN